MTTLVQTPGEISKLIRDLIPEVTEFRHSLHQFPELTWHEHQTAKTISSALEAIPNLEIKTGVGRLGVVADLQGYCEGPTIALRADMDALPIIEQTKNIEYVSKNPGVMHACGHDGHSAGLLGTVKLLDKLRHKLKGRVRFIFQPAEEGGHGAKAMVEDGVLDGVDIIYGLHGWPELPEGQIYFKNGPMMAGNAQIDIKVSGRGGHAALPHLCSDQILIAARLIEHLGQIRNRLINPAEPFVLTISTIHGGSAINVIPEEVSLSGTMRFMSDSVKTLATEKIQSICRALSASENINITPTITQGYPPVINQAKATDFLKRIAEETLGKAKVHEMPNPTMGSEDFAYYLQQVPGSYFFLGMDDGRDGGYPSLHHSEYNFNDRALATAMGVFANLALGL